MQILDVKQFCTDNPRVINFADSATRSDKPFALSVVSTDGKYLQKFSESIRNDLEVVTAAIDTYPLAILNSPAGLADKTTALLALSKSRAIFQHVTDALKDDPDVCLQAITVDNLAIKHVSSRLLGDKPFAIDCLALRGCCLHYFDEILKDDDDVVTAAVEHDGLALKFASHRIRKGQDSTIPYKALIQNPEALQYVIWLTSGQIAID